MNDTPTEGKSSSSPEQEPAPTTSGQVLRQVAVIIVVVVIWSAILVGYLALTDTSEEPPAATPQPTEGVTAPTDSPAATETALPEQTETAPSTPTPTSEPEATQPLPTPTPPEVTEVSFSEDVLPVFETRCQRCHGTERAEAGLSLSSYADVMAGSNNGPVVIPGSAETSLLIELIVSGQMPWRSPKLPETEIQAISDWVDAGAPDN